MILCFACALSCAYVYAVALLLRTDIGANIISILGWLTFLIVFVVVVAVIQRYT